MEQAAWAETLGGTRVRRKGQPGLQPQEVEVWGDCRRGSEDQGFLCALGAGRASVRGLARAQGQRGWRGPGEWGVSVRAGPTRAGRGAGSHGYRDSGSHAPPGSVLVL